MALAASQRDPVAVVHRPDHSQAAFLWDVQLPVYGQGAQCARLCAVDNASLALFYNLASGEIRQYLPKPKGFIARSMSQAMFYSQGIFAGNAHPLEKTKHNKLNPLQQITYLGILNVLLPAQVITGVLIWGLQRWPHIASELGGLPVLALVHTLTAWAFAAFIVMHVYLTTTGHSPTAGIKSMIGGWDNVEKHTGASVSDNPQGESK